MAALISKSFSFLFDPIYHWVFLLALALLFALFNRKGVRRTLFVLLLYMSVILLTPVPYWMVRHLEASSPILINPPDKKAVVILTGGTVEYNRSLRQYSWYSRSDRFLEPFRRWRKSEALFIITGRESSDQKKLPLISETESMGQFAEEFGVDKGRIILETRARSTRENAQNVVDLLQARGIDDFYLATSAFHMKRSMYSFRQLGLQPTPFPVDFLTVQREGQAVPSMGSANLSLFRIALHEYIGLIYYSVLNLFSESN